MHLIQLHHLVIEVISVCLEFQLSCRAPELPHVLVFFFFLRQSYRYPYSLRGLLCLFWWIDLLRCMLLRLFPFFSLMLPFTSICRGAFLRNFALLITYFPVSTSSSSKVSLPFCFRIAYLLPQIQHLPLPDHDVEPFISYQHNRSFS